MPSQSAGASGNGPRMGSIDHFQAGLLQWDVLAELQAEVSDDRRAYEAEHPDDFADVRVPDRFADVAAYAAIWTPLLLRELRAQTLNSLITDPPSGSPATVLLRQKVEVREGSLASMDARVSGGSGKQLMGNELVLIVREQDMLQRALEAPPRGSRGAKAAAASNVKEEGLELEAPPPLRAPLRGMLGVCTSAVRSQEGLRITVDRAAARRVLPPSGEAFLYNLGSLAGAAREWDALHNLAGIPLLREILAAPDKSAAAAAAAPDGDDDADGGGGAQEQQRRCQQKRAKRMRAAADDALALASAAATAQGVGAAEVGEAFAAWLESRFNESQRDAIAAGARGAGFTLVKGPPGTGKTTTLVALLNALHVREFNAYYRAMLALARAAPGAAVDAAWEALRRRKPHILVVAPSNAAVDNVLQRVMEKGFMDGTGGRYNPPLARVGRGAGGVAKGVTLEDQVEAVLGGDGGALQRRLEELRQQLARHLAAVMAALLRLRALHAAVTRPLPLGWEARVNPATNAAYFVDHKNQRTQPEAPAAPLNPDAATVPLDAMPEYQIYAAQLTKELEGHEAARAEIKRIEFAQLARTNPASRRSAREQLESELLDAAHLVFTTLNSSGLPCLQGSRAFNVVVVDEAAQGVELATLVPLRLGGRHCVLVGDPQQLSATVFAQQLSATVFAQGGAASQYDRSLFQRLEHAFPRAAFYDSKLKDGPNVTQPDYSLPYHRLAAFQPFVFLNLRAGATQRQFKSLSNPAEARLAVNVISTLLRLTNGAAAGNIGVITPYGQQLRELRERFRGAFGADWERTTAEASTVDGFQGREKDVIVVSLVRASGGGGVGFLADVRRMNVALTRARHALCVIGHEATLRVNPMWAALLARARAAGALLDVDDPDVDLSSYGEAAAAAAAAAPATGTAAVKGEPLPMDAPSPRARPPPPPLPAALVPKKEEVEDVELLACVAAVATALVTPLVPSSRRLLPSLLLVVVVVVPPLLCCWLVVVPLLLLLLVVLLLVVAVSLLLLLLVVVLLLLLLLLLLLVVVVPLLLLLLLLPPPPLCYAMGPRH
ncbi:AAA domain-containing protein, partial [Tribonema minus]